MIVLIPLSLLLAVILITLSFEYVFSQDVCPKVQKSPSFDARASKGSIFAPITESEINSVVNWMLTSSDLELTNFDDAAVNQNYIMKVYAAPPNKDLATAYLDGNGPRPPREAIVHVNMGAQSPPVLREYRVGPLPISSSTGLTQISYGGIADIPFNAKPPDSKDYANLEVLLADVFSQIEDEMLDSYGTTYEDPCTREFCLTWTNTAPRGPERHETLWFMFDVDASYPNVIGLTMSFAMGGVDSSQYALLLITYNHHSFKSIADFKAAYSNPSWESNKIPNRPLMSYMMDSTYGIEWASLRKAPNPKGIRTGRSAVTRLNSNLAAPQIKEPAGHRYIVSGNHVEYLGWSFFIGHNLNTGIQVFDVRFRGEKIAYEIGLSEAAAVYSGFIDLVQAATVYLDTAWGLGSCISPLIRGVDIPGSATLLDLSFLEDSGTPTTKKEVIGIFESDDGIPLRKHIFREDNSYSAFGGIGRTGLVVRVTLPVYNYDYILDHIFYPNGAMEIRAVTSGYLQATWTTPVVSAEETDFSPRVHDFHAGSLHDHFFSYKIDLDILKTNNKLTKTEIVTQAVSPQDIDGNLYSEVLSPFMVADDLLTKKLVKSTILSEQGFTIVPNNPVKFQVIAGTETNRWGHPRGYSIKLNGVAQNLIADTKVARAISFSKHSMVATKRHEDEPRITSIYDQNDPTGTIMSTGRPLVDADRLLNDGESIDGEDLVIWANIGVHHVPHSEDIPVTHTLGNSGSIFLIPTNMFDYDDSMDLGNSVYSDRSCPASKKKVKRGPNGAGQRVPCSEYLYDLRISPGSDICPMSYSVLGENLL